jgi:hypothetical protein
MDLDKKVKNLLRQKEKEEVEDISIKYARIRNYFKLCESPMEQLFMFHILNYQPYRFKDCQIGLDVATGRPVIVCRHWDDDFWEFNVKIIVQHELLKDDRKSKFRTDFLFEVFRDVETKTTNEEGFIVIGRKAEVFARLVLEVDGHEFHEKTKEQAIRDKSRDRFITGKGLPIFRFTGSEIFNQPNQIAKEVEDYIIEIMVKAERGEISPIDITKTGMWLNLNFEMPRHLAKNFGRKHIEGF